MFQCQLCDSCVAARIPAQRIVLKTRAKRYPARGNIHRKPAVTKNGTAVRPEYKDDPGGQGSEIVREVLVCPECAARWKARAGGKS